ncbi:hypothetical protein ACP70R_030306 [Stipagrostis hirtigluma subsp. patula]
MEQPRWGKARQSVVAARVALVRMTSALRLADGDAGLPRSEFLHGAGGAPPRRRGPRARPPDPLRRSGQGHGPLVHGRRRRAGSCHGSPERRRRRRGHCAR